MTAINPVTLGQEVPAGPYDEAGVERAIRDLLVAIGEDPARDGLQDTPARVARAYGEMFAGLRSKAEDVLTTTFDIGHGEMVIVRDIEMYSTCEHHLVPFHGGFTFEWRNMETALCPRAELPPARSRRRAAAAGPMTLSTLVYFYSWPATATVGA